MRVVDVMGSCYDDIWGYQKGRADDGSGGTVLIDEYDLQ